MRPGASWLTTLLRSRAIVALVIGLLVGVGVVGARQAGLFVSLELIAYDLGVRWLPRRVSPKPAVVFVWIREDEIQRFGHPLPDGVLARGIEALSLHEPRAIGIDLYRDRPVGRGGNALRRAIKGNPRTVVVEKLEDAAQPAVMPPPFLADRSQVGFSDLIVDPDGVVRRGLLMVWDAEERSFLSFSLQLALRYLQEEGMTITPDPDHPEFVRLGRTTVPPVSQNLGGYLGVDDRGYQFLFDYRRDRTAFPAVSFSEVLSGQVDPTMIRDKVALIATASPSVKDHFQSPTSLFGTEDELVYGAELHAQTIDQLLRHALLGEQPVGSPADSTETLWTLAWCLLGGLAGVRVRSSWSLALSTSFGLAVLVGSGYAALLGGCWIPIVPPAVGALCALPLAVAYVSNQERKEKALIMQLFGRFVSREVASEIWSQRDVFMEGGKPRPQRATITVMLTDLIGYTAASEKLEPGDVMEWIGTYMETMARLVEEHGGVVIDFLGDGLLAIFGVPVTRTSEASIAADARNAASCALAMEEELARLNARWRHQGSPTGRMRAGIFTGPAVVGAYGSRERLKYTSIGDTVNTAARLEAFDKVTFEAEADQSVSRILIGEPTKRYLGDAFRTECQGSHVLRGKGEPTIIHRVLGWKDADRDARGEA